MDTSGALQIAAACCRCERISCVYKLEAKSCSAVAFAGASPSCSGRNKRLSRFDRASCDQETQDYRQCVQDAMQRRKEKEKRKSKRHNDDDDYDWMDRTKEKTDEMAGNTKARARKARDRTREEKEEAKGKMKGKASDVSSKVQETADSWADKIKGFAKKADNKAHDDDDDE